MNLKPCQFKLYFCLILQVFLIISGKVFNACYDKTPVKLFERCFCKVYLFILNVQNAPGTKCSDSWKGTVMSCVQAPSTLFSLRTALSLRQYKRNLFFLFKLDLKHLLWIIFSYSNQSKLRGRIIWENIRLPMILTLCLNLEQAVNMAGTRKQNPGGRNMA